jgi:hypothetical protein
MPNLTPFGQPFEIALRGKIVKDVLSCGLRQEWLIGSTDDIEIEIDSGAGLGSPWLAVRVSERNGTGEFWIAFDIRDLLRDLFAQVQTALKLIDNGLAVKPVSQKDEKCSS